MWQEFPFNIPDDQTVVWVRIDRWSGAPFLAEFEQAAQIFTSQANAIKYPVYMVSAWKEQ